jgi:Xaa-Pro dipeptidase
MAPQGRLSLRAADPGLHRRRRDALRAQIGRPLAVFGMGSALGAGSQSHGALRYLTGWDGQESSALLVMTPAQDRLILSSPFMQPLAAETLPELDPLCAPVSAWPAVLDTLLPQGSLGLLGIEELPTGIARALGARVTDDLPARDALNRMRLIKELPALALHRHGAAICDRLFAQLPALLTPGQPALQAQRQLEALALGQGADYCRTWLTVRPQADRPRYWPAETAAPAAPGDQVLLGIALTVDGHWAHGIRMGAIGPLQPAHARLMDVAATCLQAGLALARPGVALTDLADAMEAAFHTGTRDLDLRGAQRFRFGHGLGLSYEDPILTEAFVQGFGSATMPARAEGAGGTLAPGMVLELHPNLFLPGIGGAALGDMVIITDDLPDCPIRHPLSPLAIPAGP